MKVIIYVRSSLQVKTGVCTYSSCQGQVLGLKGGLSILTTHLPKVGPIKAGWRNMAAVPRKVPRPSGVARGGAEPL